MAFEINSFKSNLIGGGARPSLFEVSLTFPTLSAPAESNDDPRYIDSSMWRSAESSTYTPTAKFLIKGASIPASTVGTYDVFFHGKAIKVAGDRTFETWETTIINDEGFDIRHKLERWMELIQNHTINTRDKNMSSSRKEGTNADYKETITVTQYGKEGNILRTYQFLGAFPSNLGAIALDWGTDGIEEFTCTWAYDSWKATQSNLGTIGA